MIDKAKLDRIFEDFPLVHDAMIKTAGNKYISKEDGGDEKFDCENFTRDLIKNLSIIGVEGSPVSLTARGGKRGYILKGLGGHQIVAILESNNPDLETLFKELGTDKIFIEPQSPKYLFTEFDELLDFYRDRSLGDMFQISDQTEQLSIFVHDETNGKVFGVQLDYHPSEPNENEIA